MKRKQTYNLKTLTVKFSQDTIRSTQFKSLLLSSSIFPVLTAITVITAAHLIVSKQFG